MDQKQLETKIAGNVFWVCTIMLLKVQNDSEDFLEKNWEDLRLTKDNSCDFVHGMSNLLLSFWEGVGHQFFFINSP